MPSPTAATSRRTAWLTLTTASVALKRLASCTAKNRFYRANRDLLLRRLPEIGVDKIAPPDGAFYIYADVSDFTSDSYDFAKKMLEEARVAATPGVDFDPFCGRNFIRFSYARSADDMREAVKRIAGWLG